LEAMEDRQSIVSHLIMHLVWLHSATVEVWLSTQLMDDHTNRTGKRKIGDVLQAAE